MTDSAASSELFRPGRPAGPSPASVAQSRLQQRRRADARFRYYGLAAILLAIAFLFAILTDITIKALPAFTQATLKLPVPLTPDYIDPAAPKAGDYDGAVRSALRHVFPKIETRADRKALDQALVRAVPQLKPGRRRDSAAVMGELPSPLAPPPGCAFHPRCPLAQPICAQSLPALDNRGGSWPTACHFAGAIGFAGVF